MKDAIPANTVISHYRILSRIGVGGMGEVYLAEDSKLRRKVALKLLSAELTTNEDRLRRFEQEAFAASALSHPNILVIHEIGSEGDKHFIATEFIEGETLRDHMARSKMGLRETLDIAVQTASALAAAHKAGIVHRDIKPENIMLREDGYAKVLDFGLAKLTERRAPSTDTEAQTVARVDTDPGTVLGTVNYMSPEQARGKAVDERTDIFSLGVLIYEMVAGRAPFQGESSTDVLAAILDREPPPRARYSREAPEALEWIVTKALRKDREERYQTVRELLTDLKGLKQRLEFEAELERSISPETSAMTAGGSAGVQAAVTTAGHLPVRSGEIDAARTTSSAEYLVSEIKDHKTGGLITVLVLVIAAAGIAYFLSSGKAGTLQSIAVLPFVNVNADPNTEYLSDGITESIINSLSRFPTSRSYLVAQPFGSKDSRQTRAKSAAMRALAIDDGLAEAHASLAIVKQTYDLDWPAAESEFRRAIELNPGYAVAHHRYSLFLPIMGRMDEAVREAKRAQELDPLSLIINENLGDILFLARRYDEAIEQLKRTLDLDSTFRVARSMLAKVYEVKGMYDEMLEERLN